MAHPAIRFRLTHNKKPVLDLPPSQTLRERVFQLYGSEIADNLVEFSGRQGQRSRCTDCWARPGYTRADKTYQEFYVNGRAIRNASLTHALYARLWRHADAGPPSRWLSSFIEIDPALVDVNVHPAKAEVRFRNQSQIHDLVRDVIREGLRGAGMLVRLRMARHSDG